jgi:ParB-like chromosome segregation protein Spo0J
MSRTSSQKLVRLDTLQPHPENATIYRDSDRTEAENDELLSSLRTHGLWDGHIQVHAQSSMILNGHRRVHMAIDLGIEEAVITLRHDLPDDPTDPEVLQFLLNGNTQREKTNTERLREFEVRKEVEKVLAKRRQDAHKFKDGGSGHSGRDHEVGDSRDLAAKKAGLGGSGSRAEKALQVLKEADQLEESAPEKAQAIKAALNKSLSTGITVAKTVTATAPAKPKAEPVAATTMKFVSTPTAAKPPMEVEGKRLRNIHRCKKLDGYQQNRTYLEREMPKAIDKIKAAERQLRKIGDHLRDQFVHDRAFPEFMTVWAEAWKEEDPSYDFIAEMEKLSGTVSLLQGALTGFQRFAHTTEVMIDRSEP